MTSDEGQLDNNVLRPAQRALALLNLSRLDTRQLEILIPQINRTTGHLFFCQVRNWFGRTLKSLTVKLIKIHTV